MPQNEFHPRTPTQTQTQSLNISITPACNDHTTPRSHDSQPTSVSIKRALDKYTPLHATFVSLI